MDIGLWTWTLIVYDLLIKLVNFYIYLLLVSPTDDSKFFLVPELSSAGKVECNKVLYCGLPYLLPVKNFIKKTHWMPAPAYNIATRTHLKLNKKEILARNIVRFNFTVSGLFCRLILFY